MRLVDKTEGVKFLDKLSNSISTVKTASSNTATSNVEASVLLQSGIADLKLEVRDPRTGRCTTINDVKSILEEAGEKLDTLEHVLPEVHGEYYRVSSKYLRDVGEYNGYYREALRYLGCIDVAKAMSGKRFLRCGLWIPGSVHVGSEPCLALARRLLMPDYVDILLSESERVFQAKCLGLAALLGDDIYNIGELVIVDLSGLGLKIAGST